MSHDTIGRWRGRAARTRGWIRYSQCAIVGRTVHEHELEPCLAQPSGAVWAREIEESDLAEVLRNRALGTRAVRAASRGHVAGAAL